MPLDVLIVDDSSFARRAAIVCLKAAGLGHAQFHEASDGREALAMLKSSSFDLLITDIVMPNMDGKALVRRVRANPRLQHIPVVVVSSVGSDVDAPVLGADAVVTKPISGPKVMDSIGELVRKLAS